MSHLIQKNWGKLKKIFPIGVICLCIMFIFRVDAIALERPVTLPEYAIPDTLIPKPATDFTKEVNNEFLDLPFDNSADFDNAERGCQENALDPYCGDQDLHLTTTDPITGQEKVVWDLIEYGFINGDASNNAPDRVNPSLWRNAKLNMKHGLYEVVTNKIYQVRGYDLSVMSLIKGDSGWIIVDPLTSQETAAAALELANHILGHNDVKAVIYTHSHVDHYGGVKGVTSQVEVDNETVKIYAPEGFLEEAVSENVLAGNVMSRRASYMYGGLLPKSETGQVDAGLGKGTSGGLVTLIPPTDIISPQDPDVRADGLIEKKIDGVTFLFQNVPGSEAPAEMLFYIPEMNAFCAAEDATHTLHNLYTLRGAKVRNPLAWSGYLNEAIDYIETIQWNSPEDLVVFASHHWPTWGENNVIDYLKKQRDLYKYIHDQTLRLANQGYNMVEIAEMIELPDSLATEWYNRGYYGSLNHDIKAVYQRYLGWFDGNPANLYPLPPEEEAIRYVEFMGGAETIIENAQRYYDMGDYRWVAKVLSHVVFADPDNREARFLEADALEQLGYQAESAPWRNFFLTGAQELRFGREALNLIYNGLPCDKLGNLLEECYQGFPAATTATPDVVKAMTPNMFFDFMALSLKGLDSTDSSYPGPGEFNFTVDFSKNIYPPDTPIPTYDLVVENSVLNYFEQEDNESATIHLSNTGLSELLWENQTLDEVITHEGIAIDQGKAEFQNFLDKLDQFEFWFNIVFP